jgi:Spy/CpxP family protein refolding chaperone
VRKIARVLLSTLLAVTMVAGTAGVALADDGRNSEGKQDGLLARVAQILNIDLQKLKDAFAQALTEMRTERQNTGLQNLVDKGTLTQEQADQLKAWLDSKPNIPGVGPRNLDQALKDGKITQEQYDAYKAWLDAKPDIPLPQRGPGPGWGAPNPDAGLQNLVENGKLTQEQADQLKAWFDARPDVPMAPQQMMEQLLKDGKITQEQYDAYQAWLAAKPDVPLPELKAPEGPGGRWHGFPGFPGFGGAQNPQPEVNQTTY